MANSGLRDRAEAAVFTLKLLSNLLRYDGMATFGVLVNVWLIKFENFTSALLVRPSVQT